MPGNESIDGLIFSTAAITRHLHNAYPVFSLRKDEESDLIEEFRQVLAKAGLSWVEHELPGLGGTEIGFAVDLNLLHKVADAFDASPAAFSEDLVNQFFAWNDCPRMTPLPENVNLPRECLPGIPAGLDRLVKTYSGSLEHGEATVLNVRTGETSKVKINYKEREWSAYPPIDDWLHAALV